MREVVVLDGADNVATSLKPLEAGARVQVELDGGTRTIEMTDAVPFGHKFAIRALAPGDRVVKYGEVIGQASVAIEPGQWVHTHNVEAIRARGDVA